MADDAETALLAMTTGIIANYVANNRVTPEELPSLISATHAALAGASEPSVEESDPVEKPTASQIRKSVSDAGLVSFIDGKTYQSLKRHLNRHEMTPADYRARYGLGPDYPMVAPAYAAKRSAIAKSLGLGQGGRKSKGRSKATK
jgi:predicted transcriptional regulator